MLSCRTTVARGCSAAEQEHVIATSSSLWLDGAEWRSEPRINPVVSSLIVSRWGTAVCNTQELNHYLTNRYNLIDWLIFVDMLSCWGHRWKLRTRGDTGMCWLPWLRKNHSIHNRIPWPLEAKGGLLLHPWMHHLTFFSQSGTANQGLNCRGPLLGSWAPEGTHKCHRLLSARVCGLRHWGREGRSSCNYCSRITTFLPLQALFWGGETMVAVPGKASWIPL